MRLTTKLTLVTTVLALLLLAISGVMALFLSDRGAEQVLAGRARLLADVLEIAAEADLRDHGKLGAIVDRVARDRNESVVFYGPDAQPVAPVSADEEPPVSPQVRDVIQNEVASEDHFVIGDQRVHLYRVPLRGPGRRVAGAFELRLVEPAAGMPQWISSAAAVAGGLLLLFAMGVSFYASRWIARPLRRLLDGMDHVIAGDLTHALPLLGTAETERIAYRFNEMTSRLRQAEQETAREAAAKVQLEGRLARSEKLAAMGQLAAEIAHEVGTPLNVIGGRAQAMARKADQPDLIRGHATIIAEQVGRITRIIEQVLDLARGPAPLRERVDVERVVRQAVGFLEDDLMHAQIEVLLLGDPAAPPLTADPDGLQQIALNLLRNAMQAMPHGGTIRVSVEAGDRRRSGLDLAPPQSCVVLTVADEGQGIAEDDRNRVFDPFFSTKAKGQGTGLGLTVVQGIVKAHDGWIEIDNAAPHGTIFRICLPAQSTSAVENVEP